MKKRQQDILLHYTIREVFLKHLDDVEYLSDEEKLYLCFGYPDREVHKRKILKRFSLEGEWWGPDFTLDKIRSSRAIKYNNNARNFYCYVREDESHVDIEIRVNAMREVGKKKKRKVKSYEWFTCTLTHEEYKKLDEFLGPTEICCCKPFHKDDDSDFIQRPNS